MSRIIIMQLLVLSCNNWSIFIRIYGIIHGAGRNLVHFSAIMNTANAQAGSLLGSDVSNRKKYTILYYYPSESRLASVVFITWRTWCTMYLYPQKILLVNQSTPWMIIWDQPVFARSVAVYVTGLVERVVWGLMQQGNANIARCQKTGTRRPSLDTSQWPIYLPW